jgi:hypothetical protein
MISATKYICNPRVLYAPNNTAADTIIVKVSKYICNPRVLYAPNNMAADTIIVKVSISISVIHECYLLLIIWQLIPLL